MTITRVRKLLILRYRLKDGTRNRRRLFARMSFRRKLPLLVGLPFVLMVTIITLVDYERARSELAAQRDAAFDAMMTERAVALERWNDAIRRDIEILADDGQTVDMLKSFDTGWSGLGEDAGATKTGIRSAGRTCSMMRGTVPSGAGNMKSIIPACGRFSARWATTICSCST